MFVSLKNGMGIDVNPTIFHVFLFLKVPNNDSPRTVNKKQKKAMPSSHIKASCWAVNLYRERKNTSGFLPPEKRAHWACSAESLQMRRVTWKPQEKLSERVKLTCESAEGVGCGLQTQEIQYHRLGQGLRLGVGQWLWKGLWPGCGLHLDDRLLRAQEDTYMLTLRWVYKQHGVLTVLIRLVHKSFI